MLNQSSLIMSVSVCVCVCVCVCTSRSVMSNFATPWTVARQAPLSMKFSKAQILEWVAIPFSRGSPFMLKISMVNTGSRWRERQNVVLKRDLDSSTDLNNN